VTRWTAPAFAVVGAVLSCGYHPLYGGVPTERLHVKLVRALVADPVAADEVVSGVRDELARAGVLEAGEGYPRVEVEVLRADETSEGVAAGAGGPRARALDVGIVARAWVARAPEAPPERDTGDLRAQESISVDETGVGTPDPRAGGFHGADALRAAARRLGQELAHKVRGEPAAGEDLDESP